jgi:hypothetical protein
MKVNLLTLVGSHIDILPFMLSHYRDCGVSSFVVNVHLTHRNDPVLDQVQAITDAFGCGIGTVGIGDWLRFELGLWLDSMRSRPDDWWILADQDELHHFPEEPTTLFTYCDRKGYDYIRGTFVDRLSSDGSLSPVEPCRPLALQYPLGGIVSANLLGAWSTKVVAAKGRVIINTGHHHASNGVACPIDDLFIPVYHYKWTAGLIERQSRRADHFRENHVPHWFESANVVEYFTSHNNRVDVHDRKFLLGACDPVYPHWSVVRDYFIAKRRIVSRH